MNMQWKSAAAGAIAGVLLCGGAMAGQGTELIQVLYDDVRLVVDGTQVHPKDANGNDVEPFIYNGTTYLPVRALAEALGKEVDWDPQTSTVTLGTQRYDWLDQMGYADYETSGASNKMQAWKQGDEDTDRIKYDRGLWFHLGYGTNGAKKNNDGSAESYQKVSYLLNGQYQAFSGTLVCKREGNNNQQAVVRLYGDGKLLYTSPPVSSGMKATPFSVDVAGCKVLRIETEVVQPKYTFSNGGASAPGIVDARLER